MHQQLKIGDEVVVHMPGRYRWRGTVQETDYHPFGDSYVKVAPTPGQFPHADPAPSWEDARYVFPNLKAEAAHVD